MAQQYPQELDALQKVIAAKPEMGYAYYKLGNTYNRWASARRRSRLSRGEKSCRQPGSHNNLGWTYGQVGKTRSRSPRCGRRSRCGRATPRRAQPRLVLLRQGDRKGAEEQYAALLTFDEGAARTLKKEIEGKKP